MKSVDRRLMDLLVDSVSTMLRGGDSVDDIKENCVWVLSKKDAVALADLTGGDIDTESSELMGHKIAKVVDGKTEFVKKGDIDDN